jgi:hypothetical protein
MTLLVALVALLFALSEASCNLGSHHPMAAGHAGVEVKAWLFKTVIVLAANLLTGQK